MLTIDRMDTRYRVAGTPQRRNAVATRLDRLVRAGLSLALEAVAQEFSAEDGPYIVVRRLRCALWLDPTGLDDPAIARLWVAALAQALHRDLATSSRDLVAHYDNRTAYLADWLADLPSGETNWRHAEFSVYANQSPGRAAADVLAREPQQIGPVLSVLHRQKQLQRFAAAISGAEIAVLWRAQTGALPSPGAIFLPRLEAALGQTAALLLADAVDADARARHALGWLVVLTQAPAHLPPEVAGPLAMQLTMASALCRALPGLPELLTGAASAAEILARLQAAPPQLQPAARWLGMHVRTAPRSRLAALGALVWPVATKRQAAPAAELAQITRSAFAGCGLLLPTIRDLGLADRLGPQGIAFLLIRAVPAGLQPLTQSDPGLRILAGARIDGPLTAASVNWPAAAELPPPLRAIKADAATHGSGPHQPALRAVMDRFCLGMRGMPGSSADYIARQFLMQPGDIVMTRRAITLRLGPVPLRILLMMGGKTGDQGGIDWLGGRSLVVEVADG